VATGRHVGLQVHAAYCDAQVGGRRVVAVGAGGVVGVGGAGAVQRIDVRDVPARQAGFDSVVLVIDGGRRIGPAVEHAKDVAAFVQHRRVQVVRTAAVADVEPVRGVDDDVARPGCARP